MHIQEKKCVRGIIHPMGFVFLLLALLVTDAKSTLEEESLLAYLMESGVIDQNMADLLQTNCLHELRHAKKSIKDLEVHFTDEGPRDGSPRAKMHDTLNVLLPQVNQILVDCVRGKKFMLQHTGEEKGSETWYTRYLGLLFNLHWSSRRRELAETPGEALAPSPAASPPSPAPSFPAVPTHLPLTPPLVPFFPQDTNNSNLQPTPGDQSSDVQSSNHRTSKRTVVIAVVVTASVTFIFAALLFFCCCRPGSRSGRNDERPLLSLSLSDYSIASSHKFGLGSSMNEEKLGNQPFNSKLDNNKIGGNSYKESHSLSNSKIEIPAGAVPVAVTNSGVNSVQMPPGLSPLKPPPGRPDPPRPPPGSTAPPPPAAPPSRPFSAGPRPPPPPPPVNPSSGGPRPLPPPMPSGISDGPRPPPPPIPSGISGGPRPPPPPPPPVNPSSGGPRPPPPPMPSGISGGPRPPPPPIPSGISGGPRPPPPPPGAGAPPPRPPPVGLRPPRPPAPGPRHPSSSASSAEGEAGNPKTKLKPFFWDKVLANPDNSMVWHQIKSGSFQFNEEEIETLFGYAPPQKNKNDTKKESSSQDVATPYIQLVDPKKAQNLSILLKALHVTTEEVCDALQEGNELPSELIQTLLRMAPTTEEELKLRLYSGELSQLGPAERFLKVLVDIPFAFKRLESLLFMCTLQEDTSTLKESFMVLEAACTELRKSRLFLKLLEAVLKTGNRMNDGTFRGGAQAFKLDTLLKLSDVKGTDGKTTLLHFVVQEIIRSEGIRAARAAKETRSLSSFKSDNLLEDSTQESDEQLRSIGLQVVSGLGNELENVKKAAIIDADSLTGTVSKLGTSLVKARNFLNSDMKNVPQDNKFHQTLKSFVQSAEVDVRWVLEEEKRIMALVKSTGDYFHGNSGKDEGLRLFVIVRDFLVILDKVCKEVKNAPVRPKAPTVAAPQEPKQTTTSAADHRQRLFPAITDRRIDSSSSDDES